MYLPSTNNTTGKFKDTLDLVESFCLQYLKRNENLIVLGDFNAHLSDSRSGQPENTRGKLLRMMFNKFNMTSINTQDYCSGSKYTYVSATGSTVVDYVFVEHRMLKFVESAKVFEDHPDNTAYHLPVVVSFNFADQINVDNAATCEVNSVNNISKQIIVWKKCNANQLEDYVNTLESCIDRLSYETANEMTKPDIDTFVQDLSDAIVVSSNKLPKLQYKKHIKPYWNDKLKKLSKQSKEAWHIWTAAGKPRGFCFETYKKYKKIKALFRKELRFAVRQYEQKEFETIAEKEEFDQIQFWKYINRKRGKTKTMDNHALHLNDQIISNPNIVANCWADYYEKLFSQLQDESFDEEFHVEVNTAVNLIKSETLVNTDDIFDIPITIYEVETVVNSLPNGKVSGFDNITYEHVKYGGLKLKETLVYLFNRIINEENIPKSFKLAVKIPIPKSNKDDMTFDNSRGISLLTTFNKILESITLRRINRKYNSCIEGLQGAYQKEQSALTSAFIIDEVINHCLEDGDKVYACYVDVAKAFDRMWINGMLYKLYFNIGIKGRAWRLIYNWYYNMKEYVCIDGKYSRIYTLHQGTRQGGVLSPWLFLVFINDLITELGNINAGVSINKVNVGSPMFADDLTLLARVKWGLDSMLQVLDNFGKRWRLIFSIKKTVVLTFGEKPREHARNISKRNWRMGLTCLKECKTWENLGKVWCVEKTNQCSHVVDNSIAKVWRSCGTIMKAGGRQLGLNPLVSLKLWKIIALPSMLYGCELWRLSVKEINRLEKAQNMMVRIMQGLLPGSSGSACRGMLGVWNIRSEIDKRKLFFLGMLINSSGTPVYKVMFYRRLIRWKWDFKSATTGFVPDIIDILQKYDLLRFINDFIDNAEFPRKNQWKKIVIESVQMVYEQIWREKVCSHLQLGIYATVHQRCEVSEWWLLGKRFPRYLEYITDVVRIICGSFTIAGKRVADPQVYNGNCLRCGIIYRNPIKHALLYCREMEIERTILWDWFLDKLPINVSSTLHLMDDEQFLNTLFGDLSGVIDYHNC